MNEFQIVFHPYDHISIHEILQRITLLESFNNWLQHIRFEPVVEYPNTKMSLIAGTVKESL